MPYSSKTLSRLVAKHPDKIQELEWDAMSDGIWLHLHYGWCREAGDPGCHSVHGDTVREVLEDFKCVCRCTCKECQDLA